MERDYYLCLEPGKRYHFTLPSRWVAAHFVESAQVGPSAPVGQMAADALLKPAGTAPLPDLVAGAKSVAVIIDDGTRPTPVAEILRVLLPRLKDAGIPREKTTIVVALGTHAPMEKEGLAARVGAEVASAYPIVQHDAWQADLVPVAIPGDERVLKINPAVAKADFRICVSSILPHPMAGYGGGPKIIMPGVANFDFIRDHHMRHTIHPLSKTGVTKENPFHHDCMMAARAVGVDFSLNCLYGRAGEIAGVIGGSLEASFSAALDMCAERLGHRFEKKVDITITSTYPHTHGPQFTKGLSAPDAVTKETGAILIVAPLARPMAEVFIRSFDAVRERSRNNAATFLKHAMAQGKTFLPDKPLEFNMAMSCVILRPAIRTILVAPLLSREGASAMGMEYAPTLEEGLSVLQHAYPEAKVAIFPSGGFILPIVEGER